MLFSTKVNGKQTGSKSGLKGSIPLTAAGMQENYPTKKSWHYPKKYVVKHAIKRNLTYLFRKKAQLLRNQKKSSTFAK